MFNKHLFKVILGFCGMIILGLGFLVIIDSMRDKPKADENKVNLPRVQAETEVKATNKATR